MVRDINFKNGDILTTRSADAHAEADDAVELNAATCSPLLALTDSYGTIADCTPQPDHFNKENVVSDWHAANHTCTNAGFAQAKQNEWRRVDMLVTS